MRPPVAVIERGIAPEAVPGALAGAERVTLDLDKIGALRLGPRLDGVPAALVVRHATEQQVERIVRALGSRGALGLGVHRLEPSGAPEADVELGGRS